MMTKIKLYTLITLAMMCFCTLQAQNDTIIPPPEKTPVYNKLMDSNYKDSKTENYEQALPETEPQSDLKYSGQWVIGAGINVIQDPGTQNISALFKSKNNHFGSPLMLSAEYLTNSRFSFSATFLLNKYQSGKDISGLTIQDTEPTYMAADVAAKMFFRKILYKHVFTPYITLGTGIRSIGNYQGLSETDDLIEVPKTRDITVNVGIGAYYWIDRTWGLNVNYISKFAMKVKSNKDYKTNHLVPTFGVFYRFNNKNFK
jgi:hypothetical protein